MVQSHYSVEFPGLSDRLRSRLESLGVTLALLGTDGSVTVRSSGRWVESLIAGSPQFTAAVRQHLPLLQGLSGQAVEVWQGVWLIPLPGDHRRHTWSAGTAPPQPVALLFGDDLTTSEWLTLLCDQQRIDREVALARIDRAALLSADQIRRLARIFAWLQHDALELDSRTAELQVMSRQLSESYEELSLLYRLSTHLTIDQPPAQFLVFACRQLQEVLGLTWVALQLTEDEPRLDELAGRVFTSGDVRCDQHALHRIGKVLMLRQGRGRHPLILSDTSVANIPQLSRLANQLLAVSLVQGDKHLGILFGGDKLDGSPIGTAEAKLCSALAYSLSIFLENKMLFADMQAMFMGTLHALTNSIDAKDSYTYGHSERVALLSRQLAAAAGLDERTIERVHISALIHDIGKIGVPEAVLCKTGPLTEQEFALIKMHPLIGARILGNMRQMQDLVPGVLYHHERWDGRGYPYQLAGPDIPLFGRLISLADACDAMSSNRTYRGAMSLEQVLTEIRRNAGTQFDPQLAELFVKLDFEPFLEKTREHAEQQARRSA